MIKTWNSVKIPIFFGFLLWLPWGPLKNLQFRFHVMFSAFGCPFCYHTPSPEPSGKNDWMGIPVHNGEETFFYNFLLISIVKAMYHFAIANYYDDIIFRCRRSSTYMQKTKNSRFCVARRQILYTLRSIPLKHFVFVFVKAQSHMCICLWIYQNIEYCISMPMSSSFK